MADVSELLIEVKNINGTLTDIDKVGKKLKQTQQEAAAFGKTLFAGWTFTKLIQGAKAFGDAWKDTLTTFRNFNAVFGEFNTEAINGAKELVNAFQMTEKNARKLLATIASRVNFGLNDKDLAKVSTGIGKLSHDIAAFYGTDFNQVSLKLSNALSGMTRGLREFGISINISSPKFQKMIQDMMISAGVTREAAQELVIYNEIIKQGKKFEGAFENSTKTLSNAFDNISQTLKSGAFAKAGKVLSDIFVPILEKINKILDEPWVQEILGIVSALGLVLISVIAIRKAMGGLTSMLKSAAITSGVEGLVSGILLQIGSAIKYLFAGLAKFILVGVTTVVSFIAGLPALAIAAIIAVLAAGAVLLINKITTGEWFNFSGMVDAVIGWFDKLTSKIKNLFIKKNGEWKSYDEVMQTMDNWISKLEQELDKITDNFIQWCADTAEKLINVVRGRGWKTNDEFIRDLNLKLSKSIDEVAKMIENTTEDFDEWRDSLNKVNDEASLENDFKKAQKKVDQSAALFVKLSDEVAALAKQVDAAQTGLEQKRILEDLKKKEQERNQALQTYKQAWANMVEADRKIDEYKKKIQQGKFADFTWYQDAMRKIQDGLGQTLPKDKIKDIEDRIAQFKKTFTHMTPEQQKTAYKELSRLQLQKFQTEMDMINKQREAIQKTNELIQDYIKQAMEWKPQGTQGIQANTMEGYKFMTSGLSNLSTIGPVLQNTQNQQAQLQQKANAIAAATKTSIDDIKTKIDAIANSGNTTKVQIVNAP